MKRKNYLNENARYQDWNNAFIKKYADIEHPNEVVNCILDALQDTPAIEALANAMDNNLDPRVAFSARTAQMLMDAIADEILDEYDS